MQYNLADQNSELSEKEFECRNVQLESFPQMVSVYTTDTCNLRCIGCHYGKRTASNLSICDKGYQRAFDVFPFAKVIGIAGAEMFFDAGNPGGYVRKLFHEAQKYPALRFVGFSNGTLITPERVKFIVEKFDWIGISIDSPYADVYRTIRVGASLDHVTENIKKIAELKAQQGLGRLDKPKIVLSSVIIDLTYKGILDLVSLAGDVGAARIHLLEPWAGTYENEYIFRDPVKTREYLDLRNEAVKRAAKMSIKVQDRTRNAIINHMPSLRRFLDFPEREVMGAWPECCDAPWNEMYIWRNGEVRVCCTSRTIIGNINENSVSEIWNSQKAREIRKRVLKGNYREDCQVNCHRGYVLPQLARKGLLSYFRKS
jgi:MoaA/NifB/PqqE/SkfB family radical SAM enzyme